MVRNEIEPLLLAVPTRDLAKGWARCTTLGRPIAPLLWNMLDEERSNLHRRLSLLVACCCASGESEDRQLFAWLAQSRPMLEERCMAMLWLSLSPPRARPPASAWESLVGASRQSEELLRIAARLAAARFPGAAASLPTLTLAEPGVAAATAFSGGQIAASVDVALWQLRTPKEHAELYWRGVLLGALRSGNESPSEERLERARACSENRASSIGAARVAALAYRLTVRDLQPQDGMPDWEDLAESITSLAAARAAAPWLVPVPTSRMLAPERLVVAFSLAQPAGLLAQARADWHGAPKLSQHAALGVAWRALGGETGLVSDDEPGAVAEWEFVRWANGQPFARQVQFADPYLAAAARLASENRLSANVARTLCEETLWRWGSHPGCARWRQERLLVRDLLLVGSHLGGSKFVPHLRFEQRFRPLGLGPDSQFFDVAVAWFVASEASALPIPLGYSLR